jgi:hypothetical protein
VIRILVTGSRNWRDVEAIRQALLDAVETLTAEPNKLDDVTLVHGGARGADRLVAEVAREYGWTVEEHPADWERHGRAAGPLRNAEMVQAGADVCLAFPRGVSRGTRGCMAMAAKAGIPVVVYERVAS